MWTDGQATHNRLAAECECGRTDLMGKGAQDSLDNINTVSSLHSMIPLRHAGMRGFATKDANRHASLSWPMWETRKMGDEETEDTAFCLLKPGKGRMTIEKLKTVGLFQPKNLKWAVA